MKSKVETKIIKILVERLQVDKESIKPETVLMKDLGADSLDIVEMIMSVEEEFSITVPDEDVQKIKTFGELVKYVKSKSK